MLAMTVVLLMSGYHDLEKVFIAFFIAPFVETFRWNVSVLNKNHFMVNP